MRVVVVLNANAGSLIGADEAEETISGYLSRHGMEAAFEPDDGRPLPERMDAALARGTDAVVVGGGDGTIACAVQRLAGTGVALGVLPLGTANLFARDIGMPLELEQAVEAICGGTVRDIDVGEVNGHVFVCNSMLGLATRLAERRERLRGTAAKLAERWGFLVSAWRGLVRYPAMHLHLEADGRRRVVRTRALTVVDGDYAEGFGRMFSRSSLDDGRLVLYLTPSLTPWRAVVLAVRMMVGHWRDAPDLTRIEADAFTIRSRRRRLRVMNDGETLLLKPPLEYRLRRGALKVIVPSKVVVEGEVPPSGGEPTPADPSAPMPGAPSGAGLAA